MRQTPLHGIYAQHGAKVVDFHGWALPVQFAGIIDEHLHVRSKAGLFDCSHMGEFVLRGAEAIAAFDRLVFSDMVNLRVGLCRYSAILNEQGGIIDDCVGLRLAEDELYLVTNAGPLDQIHSLLSAIPGVENVSEATAKLDVQGPLARDVMLSLGFEALRDLKYWNGLRLNWEGRDIVVTRAGYTGEVGYEIFVPNDLAVPLWERLAAHPDVAPCGLGARDTLRTEVGYPLNGEDLSPDKTPLASGMDRLIAWDKEFVGKRALVAQRDAGDHTVLVAIKSADRRAPRHGFELKHDGQVVGAVTSGTFGPSVGCGVGLADLPRALAHPGVALTAGPRDLPVETAAIPVYAGGTCRKKF
ncbi:MAG: glycine cleavage system aminomethyltransferase GcvT [Candidatus Hydrogenedentes bacterium]|nr:glycine cleavage system aminomethyltransferase GcvT [Candidatus Hydrogenedentota bacterium]